MKQQLLAEDFQEGVKHAATADSNLLAAKSSFEKMHNLSRQQTPWNYSERMRLLDQLERMQTENADAIVDTIDADFQGRGKEFCFMGDVFTGLNTLREVQKNLKQWMKPKKVSTPIPWNLMGSAYNIYEPLGVVLCITPWNYPVHLPNSALADLLGAGNRVIVKPSEFTPKASALYAELIAKYFSPEEVTVVLGDHTVSAELTTLPFDHIIYTGSGAVGKKIMKAAAENLVPVTLELGGKCPVYIDANYDLQSAANEIIDFKFGNSGQTCISADYILLPRGKAQDFADACATRIRNRWGTGSLDNHSQYCSIINERHLKRLQGLIKDAEEKGACIYSLDPSGAKEYPPESSKLVPTLILPPVDPAGMQVMQDEIFGPIIAVLEVDSPSEAVRFVNARPRPLAFYAFVNDATVKNQLLQHVVAGGITINHMGIHALIQSLPFGGIGPSGMGAYHGWDGFMNFSHKKPVYEHRRNILPNMTLPYTESDIRTVKKILRGLPPFKRIFVLLLVLLGVSATVFFFSKYKITIQRY